MITIALWVILWAVVMYVTIQSVKEAVSEWRFRRAVRRRMRQF